MIHPIRAWNRFFFQPTSAKPLGLIRILFGLVALMNLGLCAVELDHWYSESGVHLGAESRVIAGPLQHSPLLYVQTPSAARVAFGLTALAAVGMTVGFRTKLMSILFYLGMLSIYFRTIVSSSGADVLLMTFAFNLMLSPCGAAYSIDSWLATRRRGTEAEALILPWTLRLIQIQLSIVYFMAASLKCGGSLWLNGSALHYVLNNTEVRRLDVSFLSNYPIVINLMTYSALIFEFSLAFLVWFRVARPLVLYFGLMLHAGIFLTINIPVFGELMWVGYLAFLTPPEFQGFMRAVDVRNWFGRKSRHVVEAPSTEVADDRPEAVIVDAIDPNRSTAPEATPAWASRANLRFDGPSLVPPTPHFDEFIEPNAAEQAEAAERSGRAAGVAESRRAREPVAVSGFDDPGPWDSFQILM